MRGLEFVNHGNRDATTISNAVTNAALEAGLAANIVRSGTSGGVMRIGPPLTVKDEEIDYGLELLDGAIKSVVEH
jgi:2,2-dialkylglycine decarboxylase (pyruvate)